MSRALDGDERSTVSSETKEIPISSRTEILANEKRTVILGKRNSSQSTVEEKMIKFYVFDYILFRFGIPTKRNRRHVGRLYFKVLLLIGKRPCVKRLLIILPFDTLLFCMCVVIYSINFIINIDIRTRCSTFHLNIIIYQPIK